MHSQNVTVIYFSLVYLFKLIKLKACILTHNILNGSYMNKRMCFFFLCYVYYIIVSFFVGTHDITRLVALSSSHVYLSNTFACLFVMLLLVFAHIYHIIQLLIFLTRCQWTPPNTQRKKSADSSGIRTGVTWCQDEHAYSITLTWILKVLTCECFK